MALEDDDKEMSILDHLEELRGMFLRIFVVLGVGALVCSFFSEYLLTIFMKRANDNIQFVVISPTEGFFTRLKLGILAGFILTMPFNLLNIWKFVSPGLSRKEVKILYRVTPILCLLFLVGASLAFYLIIPFGLEFLLSFEIAEIQSNISIEKYISFCISIILIMGGTFELPVLLVLLFFVGILKPQTLRKVRRHVIVGSFVVSALLTPPDVVTQILVGIPMIALYEISILFMSFFEGKQKDNLPELEPE